MRLKIYFVTFKEPLALNETLESFFNTCDSTRFKEICIINNHTEFFVEERFKDLVTVLHNNARPDFSTGHLSRNWNQSILHGFKSLDDPDCDILIHAQNDVKFFDGWLNKVIELHQRFDFVATGNGDCFCSYTPDAIRKVGIWDERYCGIGFQEADYFIRSVYHNPDKTCINDYDHGRLHNNLEPLMDNPRGFDAFEKIGICHQSNWEEGQNELHKESAANGHAPSHRVFNYKFFGMTPESLLTPYQFSRMSTSIYSGRLPTTMLYPYFEKHIPDRQSKNYIN